MKYKNGGHDMSHISVEDAARELGVSRYIIQSSWDRICGRRMAGRTSSGWRIIDAAELPRMRAEIAARPKRGRPRKAVAR